MIGSLLPSSHLDEDGREGDGLFGEAQDRPLAVVRVRRASQHPGLAEGVEPIRKDIAGDAFAELFRSAR